MARRGQGLRRIKPVARRKQHRVDSESRELFVHRKDATGAFGPRHPDMPEVLRSGGNRC